MKREYHTDGCCGPESASWNEQVVSKDGNLTFAAVSKTMYGHYK